MSTSFETPVDQSMTAALVSALEDLTSAVSSQSESLDGLGAGPDQRISGDSVLFTRVPPLRVVVSVVLEADLYAELETSGHPATVRENRGTRTLSDVLIEDEGRGWLRIFLQDQLESADSAGSNRSCDDVIVDTAPRSLLERGGGTPAKVSWRCRLNSDLGQNLFENRARGRV